MAAISHDSELGIGGPIGSMYGIFTYIYHQIKPNVGKYTIHGSSGGGNLQHGFSLSLLGGSFQD